MVEGGAYLMTIVLRWCLIYWVYY